MKTIKEAAKEMGYSPDYLRVKVNRGKLPAVKRGRDWFISDWVIKHHAKGVENGQEK